MATANTMSEERFRNEMEVLGTALHELDITPLKAEHIIRMYIVNASNARERARALIAARQGYVRPSRGRPRKDEHQSVGIDAPSSSTSGSDEDKKLTVLG
jgi:hypothetical protein